MVLAINWDIVFTVFMLIVIVLGFLFIPRGVTSKSKGVYYQMTDEKFRRNALKRKNDNKKGL